MNRVAIERELAHQQAEALEEEKWEFLKRAAIAIFVGPKEWNVEQAWALALRLWNARPVKAEKEGK